MKRPTLFIPILFIAILCSTIIVSVAISGICASFYRNKSNTEHVKISPDKDLKEANAKL